MGLDGHGGWWWEEGKVALDDAVAQDGSRGVELSGELSQDATPSVDGAGKVGKAKRCDGENIEHAGTAEVVFLALLWLTSPSHAHMDFRVSHRHTRRVWRLCGAPC